MGDTQPVRAPMGGTVIDVIGVDERITAGTTVVVLESMKMEHPVRAAGAGRVSAVAVATGDAVEAGQVLVHIAVDEAAPTSEPSRLSEARSGPDPATSTSPARVSGGVPATSGDAPEARPRPELAELEGRRQLLGDAARPEAVARRHERGMRTARENVAALLDEDSFVEYGGFAIAAQRSRRPVDELQRATPADGLITGIGTVHADAVGEDGARCAVLAYDYTVLAGTQGHVNHRKMDRLLEVVADRGLPVVLFAEGGGGRPGDTDAIGGSWLEVATFQRFARLSGEVPIIAIVDGYCFAGNAALAGCADLLIATERSNLGMAGPAMVEGGGLGTVEPTEIGPIEVQRRNGVVDVVVADDTEAVEVARRCLGMFQGRLPAGPEPDPTQLRDLVPGNRREGYDVRAVLHGIFDTGSLIELQRDSAPGMVTALGRLAGRPVGVLANDNAHLGGAIDAEAADAAARLFRLCDTHGLPVVSVCDTPGFMVGPDAETAGGVRRFGAMFIAGAQLGPPLLAVITRKAYGLGAQAMLGGQLLAPAITLAWPTAELGPMGLEGAVRLGYRRELDAIADPEERARREDEMIATSYEHAKALNVASFGELDDVIDPADTRLRLVGALSILSAS